MDIRQRDLIASGRPEIDTFQSNVYTVAADPLTSFRIDSCQYGYNLGDNALSQGNYRVEILINGTVVGSATFQLK